jgi:plastocyanin
MASHRTRRGADRRPNRHSLLIAASIAGLLIVGYGPVDAATVTVAAINFEFQPVSRTVKEGDVVRWTFTGDPHTVTSGTPASPDGRFDSGIKDAGGSFQLTFDTAGTYRYFCQIHPEQMTGTIVVTAGTEPTPKPTAKPTATATARPTARPRVPDRAAHAATARPRRPDRSPSPPRRRPRRRWPPAFARPADGIGSPSEVVGGQSPSPSARPTRRRGVERHFPVARCRHPGCLAGEYVSAGRGAV